MCAGRFTWTILNRNQVCGKQTESPTYRTTSMSTWVTSSEPPCGPCFEWCVGSADVARFVPIVRVRIRVCRGFFHRSCIHIVFDSSRKRAIEQDSGLNLFFFKSAACTTCVQRATHGSMTQEPCTLVLRPPRGHARARCHDLPKRSFQTEVLCVIPKTDFRTAAVLTCCPRILTYPL